jgi:hypothetical protein
MLHYLLHDWLPLRRIYETVKDAPCSVNELATRLWGGDEKRTRRALEWMMVMAAYARADAESAPLLPVRFHFFFKGLNGATICLHRACAQRRPRTEVTHWSRLFLEDRIRCEEPCGKLLLPLSTCFQCSRPAVSVWTEERGEQWWALRPSTPVSQGSLKRVALTWDTVVSEVTEEGEGDAPDDKFVFLYLSCGGFSQQQRRSGCCANSVIVELRLLNADEEGNLKVCPRCGTTSPPLQSVLREFRSGEDATTSVLAEAMMRCLPPNEKNADRLPAEGRRLLAFSDSRQRAAFFALYLKRTTAESEYLKPLYDAVQRFCQFPDPTWAAPIAHKASTACRASW